MSFSRQLPHRSNRMYLTDGGIETSLIFDDGWELPHFAAFDLLRRAGGRDALVHYYRRYLALARAGEFGFVLESPTWRSSPDWATRLGYSPSALAVANTDAIRLMRALRAEFETADTPILVSGCVGPRGDGYIASALMSMDEAQAYHDVQIRTMAEAGADVITAITMTNVPEAVGIARAAMRNGMNCVIAFTVETDGRLPSGASLEVAIAAVDAATGDGPAYYMINCAHPSHFAALLDPAAAWTRRIAGVRANASCRSHAELNESTELDRGDPAALAEEYGALADRLPQLRVFGGCCGTDHHHVGAIGRQLRGRLAGMAMR